MSENLLKIPIQRFEPGKPLACDIFLLLPLNRKTICIAHEGEDLRPELLDRIISKGHQELSISWNPSIGTDPASYPLYKPAQAADSLPQNITSIEQPVHSNEESIEIDTPVETITTATVTEEAPSDVNFEHTLEEDQTEQAFSAGTENSAPEAKFGADKQNEEPEAKFSADKESAEPEAKFSADKKEKEAIRKFSSEREPKDESTFSFSKSPEKKNESVTRFSSEISAKISNRIQQLSERPGGDSDPAEMEKLLFALEKSESGEDLPPELMQSLSLDSEEKKNEELALVRTNNVRDLPGTASRLAAYLGHSMGYSNVSFLADLGAGAVIHFAKKDGATIDESAVPKLVADSLSNCESKSGTMEDFRKVITFLDAYLSDPDCDRSLKDLDKRVFSKVADSLATSSEIDPWSLQKWAAFLENGPTMDAHSICAKASARALKTARTAMSDSS